VKTIPETREHSKCHQAMFLGLRELKRAWQIKFSNDIVAVRKELGGHQHE
jgi:hypothetical protein